MVSEYVKEVRKMKMAAKLINDMEKRHHQFPALTVAEVEDLVTRQPKKDVQKPVEPLSPEQKKVLSKIFRVD